MPAKRVQERGFGLPDLNDDEAIAKNVDSRASNDGINDNDNQEVTPPKKRHRVRNTIIIVVIVVVVAAIAAFIWGYATGAIYPASAAAKYGTFDYLSEQDVTDDIMTYKEQMGYGDATDEEWAEFLASFNLTPERLRYSTIVNRLSNVAIEDKCKELGITVSDEEIDDVVKGFKSLYGFGDDEVWADTLEMYGQTEEGFREVQRLELLKEKLCDEEVEMPTPTEDEIRSYIESFAASRQSDEINDVGSEEEAEALRSDDASALLRHSYCYKYDIAGDEATLDESDQVQLIKEEFEESGTDVEVFETILATYCNDDEIMSISGDMGWDADTDEYSEVYMRMLDTLDEPGVSDIFNDGDAICFIWVDQVYSLPYSQEKLESLDLGTMPDSLYDYFSDCEAYILWQDDCDDYVATLAGELPVTLYPMPDDVPYNVDMTPYIVEEDEEDADATSEGDDTANDVSDGDEAADDADSGGEAADGASVDSGSSNSGSASDNGGSSESSA